jgi:hypothetical protein
MTKVKADSEAEAKRVGREAQGRLDEAKRESEKQITTLKEAASNAEKALEEQKGRTATLETEAATAKAEQLRMAQSLEATRAATVDALTREVTVNFADITDTGFAHFIAANGDSIDATIIGSGEPVATPDGVVFSITETYTITGGTGRFEGAQGWFRMERVANPVTFLTSGAFYGTITPPGAAH